MHPMPAPESSTHPLAAALHESFVARIAAGAVDIVPLDEDAEFEVQADAWTLYVKGWPLSTAWIALDDDASSPEEQRTLISAALDTRDLTALRTLNASLSGDLVTALTSSNDPISATLAAIIEEQPVR
jgi:hypothetical protein